MRIKSKKRKKVNPIVFKIACGVLAVALAGLAVFSYRKVQELNLARTTDTSALQAQIANMQRSGYVAMTDLKMGSTLTEDQLTYRSDIPSDVDPSQFITADDIGKTLVVNVPAGLPIFQSYLSSEGATDFTERECGFIYLNTNMCDGDYVDVRIMFPNGEDYIVAAKKCLKSANVIYNNCYLWLTEAENDLLSAAIVDANVNGAKIYMNKYVNPALQDANIVTYNPNVSVMNAIKLNPNIVVEAELSLSQAAREDTESRLKEFRELYPEYVIDDQLIDEVSRQDFIAGLGTESSGDESSTPSASSDIDITQPLPDSDDSSTGEVTAGE